MTEGICMKCGAVFLYDPARRHVCGRLEPHPATRQTASNDEDPAPAPRPRFDRKANHRRYMREWRARQTALRSHP
jgi:hypothetical protein